MVKIKNIHTLILLISFLLISTCTNDNSVTNSYDKSLKKPTDITEITTDDDSKEWFNALSYHFHMPPGMFAYFLSNSGITENMCFFAYLIGITAENIDTIIPQNNINLHDEESNLYSFRDKFLTKSSKGKAYIACFYILSEYGIKNNLINQYYREHYGLLKNSVGIAYELQHRNNNELILIEDEFSNNLRNILKIYKEHPNHRDIEPVLDYLEADLFKYQNKPKFKILEDFQEN